MQNTIILHVQDKFGDSIAELAYKAYEQRLFNTVKNGPIPKHIAIIMDGNRRFAREYGLNDAEGHKKGKEKVEEVLNWCLELNIKVLTVYAFSTENFKRSNEEIEELMQIFYNALENAINDERIYRNKVRIKIIGRKDLIPKFLVEKIERLEELTKDFTNFYFNIALAYGGREEIISAIKKIAGMVKDGKLEIEDITEQKVSENMYTQDIPDPDLLLRTSGEERISNFLLWQIAYSEIYFSDVYWPTFKKLDFLRAIHSFQLRKRRFGV
jgi:tritrans,polycis-undecaprenyl-diphosphate synthase [geranylgeranyl-diphosphate specific]